MPDDEESGRAWFFRKVNDGDPAIYIKMDHLSLVLVVAFIFMLGRLSV